MRLYLTALQFLTILPVRTSSGFEPNDLGRSTAWFPLAGLSIGSLLLLADYGLSPLFPRHLTDALLIVLLALLSGGLHLDGLADVCDGMAARGGKERFLAVMKDSRVGAVGVVGLVAGLGLKYAALLALPAAIKWQALLLFPALARFAMVLVMAGAKSARSNGLGAAFLSGIGRNQLLLAGLTVLPLCWLTVGIRGLVALLLAALWAMAVRLHFTRRLGGITGDIVGFSGETAEIISLLCLAQHAF